MIGAIKRVSAAIVNVIPLLYRLARGTDYKTLNSYLLSINQTQDDIDTIISQTAICLRDIFMYEFFAFSVYDKEFNGGIDIWLDTRADHLTVSELIKKDFFNCNTHCNVRQIQNGLQITKQPAKQPDVERLQKHFILDNETRAVLYLLPSGTFFSYHHDIMQAVVKILSSAVSNFLKLKKLENAALIDPLTHSYNRRALDKYIEHDIANAERYGTDLSVIMFDIDHFKKINDLYGHDAGDAVLRAVSKTVLSAIRKSDYLARYGGEEFLLVLPETKFSMAIELAERLRNILMNLNINFGGSILNITASFGVSLYKKGTSADRLIKKADTMLYEAKRRGRNRIKPDLRLYRKKQISNLTYSHSPEETCN